jgi:hypothetical protein
MMQKERRERDQRSQSSGTNQRSAQYMKGFTQNQSLENGRPSCALKSRERSAFDSRGGDPVTEYAYETRDNHHQRKPRWVATKSPAGSPLRHKNIGVRQSNSPRSDNKSFHSAIDRKPHRVDNIENHAVNRDVRENREVRDVRNNMDLREVRESDRPYEFVSNKDQKSIR